MIRRRLALVALLVATAAPAAAQVQLGRTDNTGTTARALNGTCRGLTVTTPSDPATGFTVKAQIEDTGGAGDSFQAALISSADNQTVLAYSAVVTTVSTAALTTFSGGTFASYNPTAAQTFHIVVCSTSAAGAGIYNSDVDGGGSTYIGVALTGALTSINPPVLAPQTMGADTSRDYVIYMEYTVEGGGGGGRPSNLMLLGIR